MKGKYTQTFEEFLLDGSTLNEVTINELVGMINRYNDFAPKDAELIGFSFKAKNAYFRTGKYHQTIKFADIRAISRLKGTDQEKVELGLESDIKVHCTCPDFLYGGFKYMGTIMDYSIYKEKRPPKIRNPKEDGTVCKHLGYLLEKMPLFLKEVIEDMETARRNDRKLIIHNKAEFNRYKKNKRI